MKITVPQPTYIEITHIRIVVDVRYDDEDIPYDFPLRVGDLWQGTVEIDTGKIVEWPQGKSGKMYMKVCDCGTYTLLENGKVVSELGNDYVPSGVIPDGGDYINFIINEQGVITNWPKNPDVSQFFDV